MTITFPDSIRAELEANAREAGLATVDEYVLMMYLRAEHTFGPTGKEILPDFDHGLADHTDAPERVAKRRERLEEMLQEGLDSGPPIFVTPQFWDDMRQQLRVKMSAKSASS